MITLYIAEHDKTKKKYFGKTTRLHTEELLQEKYHGSGVYWRSHLKKHGDNVNMKVYFQSEDEELAQFVASEFSDFYDIAESTEWANLQPENGIDGIPAGISLGPKSKETRLKQSKALKGKNTGPQTERHKLARSISKQKRYTFDFREGFEGTLIEFINHFPDLNISIQKLKDLRGTLRRNPTYKSGKFPEIISIKEIK